jgi:hypothetical protein
VSFEVKMGSRVVSEESERETKVSWKVITFGGRQKS